MSDVEPTANGQKVRPLGMIAAVKQVFRKAFVFSGRARRAEFWWFFLFYIIVSIALTIIWSSIFGPEVVLERVLSDNGEMKESVSYSYTGGWVGDIFSLITFIPNISVGVRRLHDVNYRGWWLLLPGSLLLLTIVGSLLIIPADTNAPLLPIFIILLGFAALIYLLILLIRKGTPGPNRFGPNPIEISK